MIVHIVSIVAIILFMYVIGFFGVLYGGALFTTGDKEVSFYIIKKSLRNAFLRKDRKEKIEFTHKYVNELFSEYVHSMLSTKNNKIKDEYHLTDSEVKNLRETLTEIRKKENLEFISKEEITMVLKQNREFSFIGSYSNSLKVFSNHEFILIFQTLKGLSKNEINAEEVLEAFKDVKNPNQKKQLDILVLRLEKIIRENKPNSKSIKGKNPYLETVISGIFGEDKFKSFLKTLSSSEIKYKFS